MRFPFLRICLAATSLAIAAPSTHCLAQAVPLTRGTVITEETIGVPLTRVGSVAIARNGTLAAVLTPGPQLMVIRGTGKPLLFSRAGGGPGEVRTPGPMGWRGDSLWVGDASLGRVTLFTTSGKLVRTIPVQVPGSPILLADGGTAVIPMARVTVDEQKPAIEKIQRVAGARVQATLLSLLKRYRAFSVAIGTSHMVGQQPFDDFPLWAAFNDGSGFVVVKRPAVAPGRPGFTVERYSAQGKLVFTRRYPFVPTPLTSADVEAAVSGFVSGVPKDAEAAARTHASEAVYRPKYLPTVTRVVAGEGGAIWLAREATQARQLRWTLLDSRGAVVGDFLVPAGFEGRTGTATALWGVERDEDDVPRIVEWRVPARRP
ncbi:MAG: hypothetical protein V4503_07290 [Gemmatimonadota bacterium]